MWFIDTLRNRVKKWTDTVIETWTKVGKFVEEKSDLVIEKIPGWKDLSEKASHFAEDAVNRVWKESQDLIKSGEKFIDSHTKKSWTASETSPAPKESSEKASNTESKTTQE
jgi:hypothetical protein